MNEDDHSKRIVAHLNHGAEELSAPVLDRLRVARQAAMVRARERANGSSSGRRSSAFAGQWMAVRLAVPLLILIVAASGAAYWHFSDVPQLDHEEVDAGLLADELPITAYLDSGFDSWLEETAQD